MKTIDNYINERLNPRHLGSTNKFPINGTIKDMIEFLENNGFEKIERYFKSISSHFDEIKVRGFLLNYTKDKLWFADTSKDPISADNPVFGYNVCDNHELESWYYSTDITTTTSETQKLLNKRFGWR